LIVDDPEDYWVRVRASKPRKRRMEVTQRRGVITIEAPFSPKGTEPEKDLLDEYLEHYGKWLIFSRDRAYLEELARMIDPYVERGEIESAKYNREPSSFARGAIVMCVYCHDREKEKVWEILSNLGVTQRRWKYDRQTLVDWDPGGRLYEAFKRAKER